MDNTELMLDVGQANEIKLAARRAGATNADLKKLCEGNVFAKLLPAIRGLAEVVATKHIIDCDANHTISEGWKVEEHRNGGELEWDPTEVRLHLSPNQRNCKVIEGHKLRKELANEPTLNANALDYLLAHPELIPEEWKGRLVFFWGTIFRSSVGNLCVRYLIWNGSGWYWDYHWLDADWNDNYPAVLRAS